YQAYANYHDLMDLTEELVKFVAMEVNGTTKTTFGDAEIDLGKWERLTMREAIVKWWPERLRQRPTLGDFSSPLALSSFLRAVDFEAGHISEEDKSAYYVSGYCQQFDCAPEEYPFGRLIADLFELVGENPYEAHLMQPTIIYEFPTAVSPLSKQKPDDPDWVERFEVYIGGFEIGNAFSELNDPVEQHKRFEQQLAERARGDEEAHQMDEDY